MGVGSIADAGSGLITTGPFPIVKYQQAGNSRFGLCQSGDFSIYGRIYAGTGHREMELASTDST